MSKMIQVVKLLAINKEVFLSELYGVGLVAMEENPLHGKAFENIEIISSGTT